MTVPTFRTFLLPVLRERADRTRSLETAPLCAKPRYKTVQSSDRLFRAWLKKPECARYIEIAFARAIQREQDEATINYSAGRQRVSTNAITGALIPIPPRSVQEYIVRIVDQVLDVVDNLARSEFRKNTASGPTMDIASSSTH
jgi:hypothetical protein